MFDRIKNMGPGILIAAAFIGPGTVTACTRAGAHFGYALIWALAFATIATIILQEMSARLGTITQRGLGEILIHELRNSPLRFPLMALLLTALYGGNAAYEAGNLAGASLGIEAILGESESLRRVTMIGLLFVAILILWRGNYKDIEKILVALVMVMAIAFLLTFFVVKPDLKSIFFASFTPNIPKGSLLTIIALIGTTVVPYNLFLHAAACKEKYKGEEELSMARTDAALSIGFGGLVAILITSIAASTMYANAIEVSSAADMAKQFEPLFGSASTYLLGVGLISAGLSSAITAPLATAYAVRELMDWQQDQQNIRFRATSISVLLIGGIIALLGIKPISIIVVAQFANGLLLPIITCFLLYAMNRRQWLGRHTNGILANGAGLIIVLITAGLGLRAILSALGVY